MTPGMFTRALIATLLAVIYSATFAAAAADLRQSLRAGPLTVYPDDVKRNLFYYAPGDLAIASREGGSPDLHLVHARYTGSVVSRDQGTTVLRSIFTVRIVMSGPSGAELTAARAALAGSTGAAVELRPLPIRRLESAVVYAPIAQQPAAATPMPEGHFETSESPAPREGYWTERSFTLGLAPEDAQVLSSALEHGQVALSIGYAFLADGIGPDQPIEELTGSPVLVDQLKRLIARPAQPAADGDPTTKPKAPHVVRTGAIAITADLKRWPHILQRIDINDSVPPGYAALDVYCYDFNQGESPLYEKQIEIQAAGVGGPVTLTAAFSRAQPDIYARSLRFPVAVRLDRPYRFRVVEVAPDGTSKTTSWREQTSWTTLLDVTGQGDRR